MRPASQRAGCSGAAGAAGPRRVTSGAEGALPRAGCLQMFTKTGQASRVSVVKEIAIGLTLGTALGLYWQT